MIAPKNDFDRPAKLMFGGPRLGMAGVVIAAAAFLVTCYYLKRHHASALVLTGAALVYGLVTLGLTTYVSTTKRCAGKSNPSQARKRYVTRLNIAVVVYVVALIGSLSAVIQYHLIGVVAYVLAITPALPILAVIVSMGVYLREETDEFERAVQAEAALWASGGLLVIATVWGFMELFGLAPHAQIWLAFGIWTLLLAPGRVLALRRYR